MLNCPSLHSTCDHGLCVATSFFKEYIMPHFANCTIGIKIDGEVLEEYATQVNDSHVTSWIASESNKVCINIHLSMHYYCDTRG